MQRINDIFTSANSTFKQVIGFFVVTLFFGLLLPSSARSQDCWTQVANMPQGRYNAVSFAIGDTGYVLTGQASGGTWKNEFFKFDPNSNTWTQLPNFPGTARTGAVGFSINGKGYIGTGRDDNGNTNHFWEYDPTTGNWTQKANYPPGNREEAVGFSIGNRGYIGLGLNGTPKTELYEYLPQTNSWIQRASFPVSSGRYSAIAFSIGDKGYVGTGYHGGLTINTDFWEYDPITNMWTQLANVPTPFNGRANALCFSVNGDGYVGAGNQFSDFYRYDVSSNTWTQITNFGPGNRDKGASFVINNVAYAGSGFYSSVKSDWWKFAPAAIEYLTPLVGCDSVLYQSTYYTSSDTIETIVPNVNPNGCDSVYRQPIIINNSTSASLPAITSCDSALFEGVYYYQDTVISQNLSSIVSGCDSTVTASIVVLNSSSGIDVISSCDSYTWIDGNTYSASNNSASHILSNAQGCDSTIMLDLTISNSTFGNDLLTSCDFYTWIDGVTYTSTTNSASYILTNAAGCDSTVTLDLTIVSSSSGVDVISSCEPFTWIDGNTYSTNNNSATYTLGNTEGCDSIVTLNLTINPLNLSLTQVGNLLTVDEAGLDYQWVTCPSFEPISGETNQAFTANSNGEYAVIITNSSCSDTSACFVVSGIGILENGFGSELVIYPNPTNGLITIDLGAEFPTSSVQLFDLRGALIQSETFFNSQQFELQATVPDGVYLLAIEVEGKRAIVRLIKE